MRVGVGVGSRGGRGGGGGGRCWDRFRVSSASK